MRRTSLTTLLLATALSGIAVESRAAATMSRMKSGGRIPHHRTKGRSPRPSDFEKNQLRPATLNYLRAAGKISPRDYAAMTRGAK